MQGIPLTQFVEGVGQIKAAAALRMSQGGISKALKAERQVYVTQLEDGSYSAHELKPFPSQKSAA